MQLDKYFLLQSNANYPFIDQKTNINAGMGSMLAQKKIWMDARGLSEAKASHGGDDIELLSRLTEKHLQIDTSVFGIWQYKLARTEGTRSMIADHGPQSLILCLQCAQVYIARYQIQRYRFGGVFQLDGSTARCHLHHVKL